MGRRTCRSERRVALPRSPGRDQVGDPAAVDRTLTFALNWLGETGRLKGDLNPIGLAAGEAAAAVLLEPSQRADQRTTIAHIIGVATGKDAPIGEGDVAPLRGRVLAEVLQPLLTNETADLYLDLNGEAWRAQEYGHALVGLVPSGLQKVKGLPFRTAFAPWPNNAHHLIPDAQLMNGIFDLAADLPTIQETIVQGLLKSPYNLHHWKNMMILPLDPKHGCALGLPTHPQGDTHPAYNIEVRTGVDEALSPYKAVIKQVADKENEHEVVDPVDVKEALEALSDALHTSLIALKPEIFGACAKDEDISLGAMTQFITTSPGA